VNKELESAPQGDSQGDRPRDAVELNDKIREMARTSREGATNPGPESTERDGDLNPNMGLRRDIQFALDHWSLGESSSIANIPGIASRLGRIPLVGGMLAFAREIYGSLWLKANRRSPIGQQIELNHATARAIKTLAWHVESSDLDKIWIDLDRETQAVRTDVGSVSDSVLRLERQVTGLLERVTALESALAAERSKTAAPAKSQTISIDDP
jgi:hypothetical protein